MKKAPPKKPDLADIELHPDAWKRFEDFVTAKVPTRPAPTPKRKPSRTKAATSKAKKRA
jgi:hypothetical protein